MLKKLLGFTIIELLITISVMALLFGIGAAKYISFNQGQIIKQAAQKLRSDLRVAASRAITGEKDNCTGVFDGYLVNINSSNYTIKSQCSIVPGPGNTYGTTTTTVSVSPLVLSPAATTIFFKALGQGVNAAASITLSGFSKTETVTVNLSGEIQ